MVVVVFRSRIRPGVEQELERVGGRMFELACAMPGFVSYKDYAAADGESVSIIEFRTLEDVTRWRDHLEHKAVQERGRREFFSEYRIQVCNEVRESRFPAR